MCASYGLAAQDFPFALKFIRVGLAVQAFGAEITIGGNGSQEVSTFSCGFGPVASESEDWVRVCILATDIGAVLEKGAVLDAAFESVSVGL